MTNFGGVQSAGSHGGVQKFWGGPIRVPWGGSIGGPMLKSQKLGGSNVPIPKVGGVRTPPTRAVAAPMLRGESVRDH